MAYYPKDRNPSGVIFFGDGGQHQVLESESTFVYKTGDGYLGIGTNNPFWELDVSGTGTFREIRWADGTSQTTAAAGAYTFDAAAGNETAVTINNGDVLRFSGLDGIAVTRSSQTMQFDLKDTAVTPGSYGDASTISTFTVDQQGRLTAAGETSVSITASQVSDFGSQVSGVVFDANNFVDSTTIDFTVLDGVNVTGAVKTNSISEDYLTTSVAGDGLAGGNGTPLSVSTDGTTIETNGDAIRIAATAAGDGLGGGGGSALSVNTDGTTIETNGDNVRIAATAAGDGLGGGGGSALSVNVDDSTIEINADALRVKDGGITEAKISRTVQYNPVPVGELTFDINMVSGANEAYTLPTVTSNTGKIVRVKKTDQAASSVRISGNAVGELIDSGNIYFLYNYNESVTLICDGSDWQVF